MFSEPEPLGAMVISMLSESGSEVELDDRHALSGIGAGVLAGERMHGIGAQRILRGRALAGPADAGFQFGNVDVRFCANQNFVDRQSGVLADQRVLLVGGFDVFEDREHHLLGGVIAGFLFGLEAEGKGGADIGGNVFERDPVEVSRDRFDGVVDRGHVILFPFQADEHV